MFLIHLTEEEEAKKGRENLGMKLFPPAEKILLYKRERGRQWFVRRNHSGEICLVWLSSDFGGGRENTSWVFERGGGITEGGLKEQKLQ